MTSETGKYLFRAANGRWRCAQYFVIASFARCLETIDVCRHGCMYFLAALVLVCVDAIVMLSA